MDAEEFAQTIALRGYTAIPDALSPAGVACLRAALDRLQAEDEGSYGTAYLASLNEHGIVRNLPNRGQVWLDLLDNPVVLPLVERILGASYTLLAYNGITLLPNAPNTDLEWHRDTAVPLAQTYALNCLYLLDDYTAENGATWVVPGSHGRFGARPAPELLRRHAVQVSASAGSCLAFDSTIWHCGGINRSAAPRRVVGNVFTNLALAPQLDFATGMDHHLAASLSPRTRRLLHVDTTPPASVQAFLDRKAARRSP
jgi:ectoine hydroxylase-related dioxygenase (phytanoyl-CoA dioxygenase family)